MIALQRPHDRTDDQTDARRSLIAEALAPFVEEMRLLDCADLIAHVAREQFANIEDLVQSSLELSYKQGAFAFGWGAHVIAPWNEPPAVALDLEFCTAGLTIFFVLTIGGGHHDVMLRKVSFTSSSPDPRDDTRMIAHALATARL